MSFTFLRRILVMLTMACTQAAFAYPFSNAMTIPQLLNRIEKSSPRLARAKAELAAIKSEYTGSRAVTNPEFSFSEERLQYPAGDETERTIGLSQDISFLWTSPSTVGSREASYEAAMARYMQEKMSIQCDALIMLERREQLERQIKLTDDISGKLVQVKSRLDARVVQGDASAFDSERFKLALLKFAGLRAELRQTKSEVTLALMELTSLDADAIAKVKSNTDLLTLPFTNVKDALEYSTEHSFALKSARWESLSARRNVAARKWAMVPNVSLGIGRKQASGGINGPIIEAQIELPLLNQGRSDLSKASADLKSADLTWSSRKKEVSQIIEDMWMQLSLVEADIELFEESQSSENTDRAIQLYNAGEISSLEAVDMLQSIVEAENTLADLRMRQRTLVRNIAIASGIELFAL